jgi:hypothetical protein
MTCYLLNISKYSYFELLSYYTVYTERCGGKYSILSEELKAVYRI